MNLIYIKTFLEIAATRNFERAAKNLNIAQSTASARINTLEESLGHSLFNRNRSGFEITEAGIRFQKYALNVMGINRVSLNGIVAFQVISIVSDPIYTQALNYGVIGRNFLISLG